MRFALVALIAPLVLASPHGSDSGLISIQKHSDAAAARWDCSPSDNYCGWYLIAQDDEGWSGIVDPDALYQCVDPDNVSMLSNCPNGCSGPAAHCR
ncbi:hypothetical protein B0T20DRAFT_500421 [Sordaria brevicollis]|uniref:Uncharacterized protein n=1 Tax=Sordaria brevicollis TaxID=83679 RepID=A0AAE0PBL5_SORBR|nr:hypothetical protein B0T20DRAFT_500421 [Sordaria brevicollis]